ncbi:MAG TPA: lipid II flippase MurJ, partial [bacterium]|nr:lipid II flippase MurJ [bacterium]
MSRNKNRFLVFKGIFLSRISGFLRDFVIAHYFGANHFTDAFLNAFSIPNLLRGIFAEGNLSSAFIPTFVDEYKKDKELSV